MNTRPFLFALVVAGSLFLGGAPAFARVGISGSVYQVAPRGVYLQNVNGITFVPSASATFRIGNTPVSISALGIGHQVQAYCQPGYRPQYVPVAYYRAHPHWDWHRHVKGWSQDRAYWRERDQRQHSRYDPGDGRRDRGWNR